MGDSDFLKIQYETLQQAQTDLGVAYTAAKNAIDELRVKLDQSLGQWSGDAQTAYVQVKNDWDRAFGHMADVLAQAHVHMGNAHELYQQVERQNVSIWQGSSSSGG
jgi:WXG100 family type VII secretion target